MHNGTSNGASHARTRKVCLLCSTRRFRQTAVMSSPLSIDKVTLPYPVQPSVISKWIIQLKISTHTNIPSTR